MIKRTENHFNVVETVNTVAEVIVAKEGHRMEALSIREEKELVIQKLKEQGCRITKQRLMLLDIILEEDCSCCKEIYYKASKKDKEIGSATVYRMVNTLEEIGAISRKNMYKISFGEMCQDSKCGSVTM